MLSSVVQFSSNHSEGGSFTGQTWESGSEPRTVFTLRAWSLNSSSTDQTAAIAKSSSSSAV